MDDVTNKRFADLEARLAGAEARLAERIEGLGKKDDELRAYMTAMEMRLATAITGLAGGIADIKAFLVDRDQTQSRLAKIEERLEKLDKSRASGG